VVFDGAGELGLALLKVAHDAKELYVVDVAAVDAEPLVAAARRLPHLLRAHRRHQLPPLLRAARE
jgi:hypothetical protein